MRMSVSDQLLSHPEQQQSKKGTVTFLCGTPSYSIHMPAGYFSGWATCKIRSVSAEYKRWLFIITRLLLGQCSRHVQKTGWQDAENVRIAVKNSASRVQLNGGGGCWTGLKPGSHCGVELHIHTYSHTHKKKISLGLGEPFNTHLRPPSEASEQQLSRGSPTLRASPRAPPNFTHGHSPVEVLLRWTSICFGWGELFDTSFFLSFYRLEEVHDLFEILWNLKFFSSFFFSFFFFYLLIL